MGNKLIILMGLVLLWFISYYYISQNLVLIHTKLQTFGRLLIKYSVFMSISASVEPCYIMYLDL